MSIWNKQYQNRINGKGAVELQKFKEKHPTAQSFRNFCYREAERDSKKNFEDCNSTFGYCVDCTRTESWDTKK